MFNLSKDLIKELNNREAIHKYCVRLVLTACFKFKNKDEGHKWLNEKVNEADELMGNNLVSNEVNRLLGLIVNGQ